MGVATNGSIPSNNLRLLTLCTPSLILGGVGGLGTISSSISSSSSIVKSSIICSASLLELAGLSPLASFVEAGLDRSILSSAFLGLVVFSLLVGICTPSNTTLFTGLDGARLSSFSGIFALD